MASISFLGSAQPFLPDAAEASTSSSSSSSSAMEIRLGFNRRSPAELPLSRSLIVSSMAMAAGGAAEEWWKRPSSSAPQSPTFLSSASATAMAPPDFFSERPFELQNGIPSLDRLKLSEPQELEHPLREAPVRKPGVPVYVMLPLDSVTANHQVHRRRAMDVSFQALKNAGVEGVMMDVWWGIVQKDGPHSYNWSGYMELMEMAKKHGLKVQAVMSFHQCGGNVGDSAFIPLPLWVVEEVHKNADLVYTDRYGNRNYEYLSLGCDELPVIKGRTPIQVYADFMRNFRDTFKDFLGDVIAEIQVGMGPAGELRYPGYPERDGIWKFPGVGEFQCYDKYLIASLKASATAIGKPEWGCPPSDAGNYRQWPEDSVFFKREGGGWDTDYGRFFLEWHSGELLQHGDRLLSAAAGVFRSRGVRISGKVAGIHWHYGTRSHAAELTAGYYNTRFRDGYLPMARLFARHGAAFNFTCFEMKDCEQPSDAKCSPEGLLKQVAAATKQAGVALAGENALPRFDEAALQQIAAKSRLEDSQEKMCAFTFLRMSEALFQPDNWSRFVRFVKVMAEDGDPRLGEKVEHRRTASSEQLLVATSPLIQEAAAALV